MSLKSILLAENPFDPSSYEVVEVESIHDFLRSRFKVLPATTRIYHKEVAEICDVTPVDEASITRLGELEGPFFVIVYPGDPVTVVVAVVAVAAAVAAAYFFRPSVPNTGSTGQHNPSSNNELSSRQNKERLNGRIPDIFGTVRSIPDLLSVPYTIFKANEEVEFCFMCIGRGTYEIHDVRDDTTKVSNIAGAAVEIYSPGTSPNYAPSGPQLRVGNPITDPFLSAKRITAVNGQILRPPNVHYQKAADTGWAMSFAGYPNYIEVDNRSPVDLTELFQIGDEVTVSNVAFSYGVFVESVTADRNWETGLPYTFDLPSTITNLISVVLLPGSETPTPVTDFTIDNPTQLTIHSLPFTTTGPITVTYEHLLPGAGDYDLNGTYTVQDVNQYRITFANPAAINPGWNVLELLTGGAGGPGTTPPIDPHLDVTDTPRWIGPFVLDGFNDVDQVFANFVAPNGLYKDAGSTQEAVNIDIELEVTPLDEFGVPGVPEVFPITIKGTTTGRSSRGITLMADPTFSGACEVRVRRLTDHDYGFDGSLADEVKWRDLFAMTEITEQDFGNVTTVRSLTAATKSALSIKDRKLNMLVTRKLPVRVGDSFTSLLGGSEMDGSKLASTNRVDDIFCAITLDPYIGNRTLTELGVASIYATIGEAQAYFGTPKAIEFCYTFDDDNFSFEETATAVAMVAFCHAYRRGNVVQLSFERENPDSSLLFNHRNKIPGTEKRTVTFGNQNDNDGVEFEYVDPEDDAIVTIYLPESRTAVNPKKIESIGIRNKLQAWIQAWRYWNKIQYQNIVTEFEATQEADILVLWDRILVADNTRPETQDGDVLHQNIIELTLSQEVELS